MRTGQKALHDEDRAIQLVNRLSYAGARPTLITRLMGGLVSEPQVKRRFRLATMDGDRQLGRQGSPGSITQLRRLGKPRSALLARVLQRLSEVRDGGFRPEAPELSAQDALMLNVELLLAGWTMIRAIAEGGSPAEAEMADEFTFDQLERAYHFVFAEQSIGLVTCTHCESPNLRFESTAYMTCGECSRRIAGVTLGERAAPQPRSQAAQAA